MHFSAVLLMCRVVKKSGSICDQTLFITRVYFCKLLSISSLLSQLFVMAVVSRIFLLFAALLVTVSGVKWLDCG